MLAQPSHSIKEGMTSSKPSFTPHSWGPMTTRRTADPMNENRTGHSRLLNSLFLGDLQIEDLEFVAQTFKRQILCAPMARAIIY